MKIKGNLILANDEKTVFEINRAFADTPQPGQKVYVQNLNIIADVESVVQDGSRIISTVRTSNGDIIQVANMVVLAINLVPKLKRIWLSIVNFFKGL
jgi:hypothetical protein